MLQMTEAARAVEEKLAHLERLAADLSDVVADHSRRIATLEAQVARLRAREMEQERTHFFGDAPDPGQERPPHW